ncbi:carboxymuconolactone decarboxylase family protein [Vibrio palustris]|uniref:Carboxymuconolactone decarboxylase family protein n=1 Tax=Vibrio palustris TaxID=1918946 RepID=A0A1R4B0Y2_9VIBR|nr:carboxymuconolactone decarboxylase family protein [Vibrio palustris]SJL82563.1 Carboxymuconolactone decarboxylase family protein [Vibrio palustris]
MTSQENELMTIIAQLAPQFHRLTIDTLFGQVWQDDTLSLRERSLITVSALIALNRTEQLPGHLQRAFDNGLTNKELSAVMTHLAFYAGWPVTASAIERLDEVNNSRGN